MPAEEEVRGEGLDHRNGNGKNDVDGSYVFVEGNDVVDDDPVEIDCNGVGDENVVFPINDKDENAEKGNCIVNADVGSLSDIGGVGLEVKNQGELGGIYGREEENSTVSVVEPDRDEEVGIEGTKKVESVEEIPKSQVGVAEANESEGVPKLDVEKAGDECKNKLDNGQVEESQESKISAASAKSEQFEVDNGKKTNEEESNLDSTVENEDACQDSAVCEPHVFNDNKPRDAEEINIDLEEVQESCNTVMSSAESELLQLNDEKSGDRSETNLNALGQDNHESQITDQIDEMANRPKDAEENKLHTPELVEEIQESQTRKMSSAESQLHQLDESMERDGEISNLRSTWQVEDSEDSEKVPITESHQKRDEVVDGEGQLDSVGRKGGQETENIANGDVQIGLERGNEDAVKEVPLKGSQGDLVTSFMQNSEMRSCLTPDTQVGTVVVNGVVSIENGDGLPSDHAEDSDLGDANRNTCEKSGSSENYETVAITYSESASDQQSEMVEGEEKSDLLERERDQESENVANDDVEIVLERENEVAECEVSLKGSLGDSLVNLKQNSEMASCPPADIQLATVDVNALVSIENGDGLPSGQTQDSDLGDATLNTCESSGASENSETVCFGSFLNLHAETGQSIPTASTPDLHDDAKQSKQGDSSESVETIPTPFDCREVLVKPFPSAPDNDEVVKPHSGDVAASTATESIADGVNDMSLGTEIEKLDVKNSKTSESSSFDECVSLDNGTCTVGDDTNAIAVKNSEFENDANKYSDGQVISVNDIVNDSGESDSLQKERSLPIEIENASAVQVENGVYQFDKPVHKETESIDVVLGSEMLTLSEDSTVDSSEGPNVGPEVEKRPFYFLIRIPRYDDENIKEQIKHAQLQVDEKTQKRDAIRDQIRKERAICKEYNNDTEAVMLEERSTREMLKSKRQEVDSAQFVINRAKNAISLEDIDSRLRNMQHKIEHETVPLKEEKQLIREIKQLKQLREQLSSNMGKQDEVQQALDQKGETEDRLKYLRKEVDLLRDQVLKADTVTKAAKNKYLDRIKNLNDLQSQFKAADKLQQEAYKHLQSLKKQLYEKSKHLWKYRDDAKVAYDYSSARDREALQHHCVNQVEEIMELWNKNDEFRKDYIRCNTKSTLRRLRTLDGRALGPNEELPVIPNVIHARRAKENTVSLVTPPEQEKPKVPKEADKPDDKSAAKVVEIKNQTAKTKKHVKAASSGKCPAIDSHKDEIEEVREKENKLTKEEVDLARKADDKRKKEEEDKLKEQRRLEEKAKAKEALERKKRNAEKARAKAALRAQKEAEEKEREREKRAEKKERKKAAGGQVAARSDKETETIPSSEPPPESSGVSETKDKPSTVTKRVQKTFQLSKGKSVPLPLRNRGKRRMHKWMWFLLAVVLLCVLFWVVKFGF